MSSSVRAVLFSALVVLGLASFALADDSTTQPRGRQSWQELFEEYRKAHEAHGDTASEILAVERLLQEAEAKLAPLRAAEARLVSANAPREQLAEAHKAVYERVLELKVPENTIRHSQLVKRELETREMAIQTGGVALRAMYAHLERLQTFKGLEGRERQLDELREKSLKLVRELDFLETEGGPLLPNFEAFESDPADPRGCEALIANYLEDAKTAEDLAESLEERAALKRTEKDHLVKLEKAGAKLDRLPETLKNLDDRLAEIETARSKATQRAKDLRKEIERLERRKAEIEAAFTRDGKKAPEKSEKNK